MLDGFLSLVFFAAAPFTVGYASGAVIAESPATLEEPTRDGAVVMFGSNGTGRRSTRSCASTSRRRDDRGRDPHGQRALIFDESLASEVGVDLTRADVRRIEGSDETGHRFTRYLTRLAGAIRVTEGTEVAQPDPEVVFQRIVHEGLVGNASRRRFTVTYDVPRER